MATTEINVLIEAHIQGYEDQIKKMRTQNQRITKVLQSSPDDFQEIREALYQIEQAISQATYLRSTVLHELDHQATPRIQSDGKATTWSALKGYGSDWPRQAFCGGCGLSNWTIEQADKDAAWTHLGVRRAR
jgi:hypothetical protein